MATVTPHIMGTTSVEPSRSNRLLSVRIYARTSGVVSTAGDTDIPPLFSEGPSCLFVGPIDTASKETLEALYRQARDAYYSGNPLIVDDMFDRVELKLRWYGSKYVVKYPRCSLKRLSTYADTQEDPSQVFALASVWLFFLGFGGSALLMPIIYTFGLAYPDTFDLGFSYNSHPYALEFLSVLNGFLFMALGSAIGYPIAAASGKVLRIPYIPYNLDIIYISVDFILSVVGALRGLWKNDLVALKGACPNCGEEVFAFVRLDPSNKSPHRADCHVCESSLEFRTKVEESISSPSRRWVHGRIYLVRQRRRSRTQRKL